MAPQAASLREEHARELRGAQERCDELLRRAHEAQLLSDEQLERSRRDTEKVCAALSDERKRTAAMEEQAEGARRALEVAKLRQGALQGQLAEEARARASMAHAHKDELDTVAQASRDDLHAYRERNIAEKEEISAKLHSVLEKKNRCEPLRQATEHCSSRWSISADARQLR